MDTKSGPAAVVRNVACVFRGLPYSGRRVVIADRFYTSIALAQQLRTMGFNFVGTNQTNRKGWCKEVQYPFKKRPAAYPRGSFKMAVAKSNPGLAAVGWVDNRTVYFLSSQVETTSTTVQRREKSGALCTVPRERVPTLHGRRGPARSVAATVVFNADGDTVSFFVLFRSAYEY